MRIKSKILVIAGSDSSGGAGIQADIKTVTALGSYAMTAITAVTAQNTKGVYSVFPIGPKEIEEGTVELARRDNLTKSFVSQDDLASHINKILSEIQSNLFDRALAFRESHTTVCDSYEDFKKVLESKGGFISAHWDGTDETEMKIKQETKATIRCIPNNTEKEEGKCIYSGKPSVQRVIFAKAY